MKAKLKETGQVFQIKQYEEGKPTVVCTSDLSGATFVVSIDEVELIKTPPRKKKGFSINILGADFTVYFQSFNNTVTICTIVVDYDVLREPHYFQGKSYCNITEGDVFDEKIGKEIAFSRAIGEMVSFINDKNSRKIEKLKEEKIYTREALTHKCLSLLRKGKI
jgi:hypothetical protein